MTDREKVIKALQQCVGYEDADNKYTCIYDGDTNPNCPYGGTGDYEVSCMTKMMQDAFALLKAQEPVMVEERADTDTINCPKCGQQFAKVGRDKSIYLDTDEEPNYCPKCGQAVKWE